MYAHVQFSCKHSHSKTRQLEHFLRVFILQNFQSEEILFLDQYAKKLS